jgi:hypothetical protein
MYFITSTLGRGEFLLSHCGPFTTGERTVDIHWTGGWVGSRFGQNVEARRQISVPAIN